MSRVSETGEVIEMHTPQVSFFIIPHILTSFLNLDIIFSIANDLHLKQEIFLV